MYLVDSLVLVAAGAQISLSTSQLGYVKNRSGEFTKERQLGQQLGEMDT